MGTVPCSSREESASHSHFLKRSAARLAAVQALYQIEYTSQFFFPIPQALSKTLEEFYQRYQIGPHKKDKWNSNKSSPPLKVDERYFTKLVEGTVTDLIDLDASIGSCLSKEWTLPRLESVILAILRVGAHELKTMPAPTAVLVNEYLEVTRAFFDDKETAFVNGVLDALAQNLRPSST